MKFLIFWLAGMIILACIYIGLWFWNGIIETIIYLWEFIRGKDI